MKPMKIIASWTQVIFVLLIVGYGTWQLFEGHFQESFATPLCANETETPPLC